MHHSPTNLLEGRASSPAVGSADVPDLLRRWRATSDPRCAEALVLACEPLTISRVRRLRATRAEVEDLLQVGRLAVWKALSRYVPGGAKFTTFAVRTIDGELKHYCRDRTWDVHVPRGAKARMIRVLQATADLESRGVAPTVGAIASSAGLAVDDVHDGLAAARARIAERFEQPVGRTDALVGDRLAEADVADPDVRLDLRQMIAKLPADQAEAVTCRYFLDMSQREIAVRMSCTPMQVSRLLERARRTLAVRLSQ